MVVPYQLRDLDKFTVVRGVGPTTIARFGRAGLTVLIADKLNYKGDFWRPPEDLHGPVHHKKA